MTKETEAEKHYFDDQEINETKECDSCNKEKNILDFKLCEECNSSYCNSCMKGDVCQDCYEEPSEESNHEESEEHTKEDSVTGFIFTSTIVLITILILFYLKETWALITIGCLIILRLLILYLSKIDNKKSGSIVKRR